MRNRLSAIILTIVIAGCGGGAQNGAMVPNNVRVANPIGVDALTPDAATSVLKLLTKQSVIGSTIDPKNGDKWPTALTIFPHKAGLIGAGDLVACNYDNSSGTSGTGTTMVALAPKVGSKPVHVAVNAALLGCTAATVDPANRIWTAATGAKAESIFMSTGALYQSEKNTMFPRPLGSFFMNTGGPYPTQATFLSDSEDGTVVRIDLNYGQLGKPTTIIKGFKVNKGVAGNILGPTGLVWQQTKTGNTLYVVDSANNIAYAFGTACNAKAAPASNLLVKDAITVSASGTTFTGADAKSACVIHSGAPLAKPLGATVLYNGNLVVANGQNNDLLEYAGVPNGKLLDTRVVDKGVAGALYSLTSTGKTTATTVVYFTDGNSNNIQSLSK
jgi:hypothetical protein